MRSLACCGVSATDCARAGGDNSGTEKSAAAMLNLVNGLSLARDIRIDIPQMIIQAERVTESLISTPWTKIYLHWGGGRDLRGGQICSYKEQHRVGGDMQVKVEKTVHQESRQPNNAEKCRREEKERSEGLARCNAWEKSVPRIH